jgi:hypothetical protein
MLIVTLKEPPLQLLVTGSKLVKWQWRRRTLGIFPRRIVLHLAGGGDMLIDPRNVLVVKAKMTEDEVEKFKTMAKAQAEAVAKQGRKIIEPQAVIPSSRNH